MCIRDRFRHVPGIGETSELKTQRVFSLASGTHSSFFEGTRVIGWPMAPLAPLARQYSSRIYRLHVMTCCSRTNGHEPRAAHTQQQNKDLLEEILARIYPHRPITPLLMKPIRDLPGCTAPASCLSQGLPSGTIACSPLRRRR